MSSITLRRYRDVVMTELFNNSCHSQPGSHWRTTHKPTKSSNSSSSLSLNAPYRVYATDHSSPSSSILGWCLHVLPFEGACCCFYFLLQISFPSILWSPYSSMESEKFYHKESSTPIPSTRSRMASMQRGRSRWAISRTNRSTWPSGHTRSVDSSPEQVWPHLVSYLVSDVHFNTCLALKSREVSQQ